MQFLEPPGTDSHGICIHCLNRQYFDLLYLIATVHLLDKSYESLLTITALFTLSVLPDDYVAPGTHNSGAANTLMEPTGTDSHGMCIKSLV